MRQPSHVQAIAIMGVATFLWGTAGVVSRHLTHAQSFEVAFWRSAFTALFLGLYMLGWQRPSTWHSMRHSGWTLWVSGLCWAIMFTAFMMGLTLTSVANVLITLCAGPLLTALVSWLVFGLPLPVRTKLAIALAGAGIGWMFVGELGGGGWLGSLVAMCSPLAAAFNWNVVRHHHARQSRLPDAQHTHLMPAVWLGALFSAVLTLPMSVPFAASAWDIGLLAGLGLFQLALPSALVSLAALVLRPTELSLLTLLEVLFGIGLAWVGAGEVPSPSVVQGGALVLAALVFNELGNRRSAT